MRKSIVMKVLGAVMAMSLVFSAVVIADETEAGAEVSYEADVNGDGKIVVGYISKNFTDPFHAPINARAEEYFDQAVEDGIIDEFPSGRSRSIRSCSCPDGRCRNPCNRG